MSDKKENVEDSFYVKVIRMWLEDNIFIMEVINNRINFIQKDIVLFNKVFDLDIEKLEYYKLVNDRV